MNHASQPTINTLFVMKNILAIMAASLLFGVSHAATITVNDTADNTTTDGRCTLREAVLVANSNVGTADCPLTGDTASTSDTIEFSTAGNQIDLSEGVMDVTEGLTISATAEQSMILDGGKNTPTDGTHRNGDGGMFNVSAFFTIKHLVLQNQVNTSAGGAINATGNFTLIVYNSVLKGNEADNGGGGAIHASGTSLQVANSTFTGNRTSAFADGGAIQSIGSLLIFDCLFENNQSGRGGALKMRVLGSSYSQQITNSRFNNNIASLVGGAMRIEAERYYLDNLQFEGNFAQYGGAIAVSSSALSVAGGRNILRSSFINNTATVRGGAIAAQSGAVTVSDNTFVNNQADNGGALAVDDGEFVVQNSTIIGNNADSAGGAFFVDPASTNPTILTLSSNILLENNLSGATQNCNAPVAAASSHNLTPDLITDGCGLTAANNNQATGLAVDALLAPLGDYGCARAAGVPDSASCISTRRPLSGSFVIDKGTAHMVFVGSLDQRGSWFARTIGAATDMGAVEYGEFFLTVVPPSNGNVSADITPAPQAELIDACSNVTSDDCRAKYISGDVVTLVATPNVGYRLDSWGSLCSGSDETTMVTVSRAYLCSASFVALSSYTISGSVLGLETGDSITLQNNGSDSTSITGDGSLSDAFNFTVYEGDDYAISVSAQPTGKTCTVSSGDGSNVTADVSDVRVNCGVSQHTLGGDISGLAAGESITLTDDNGQTQTFSGGAFTFANPLPHGSSYAVTVTTAPAGKICTVTDGSGNITMNTDSVAVDCVSDVRPEAVFSDGFE